jgi:hypothetical protein
MGDVFAKLVGLAEGIGRTVLKPQMNRTQSVHCGNGAVAQP